MLFKKENGEESSTRKKRDRISIRLSRKQLTKYIDMLEHPARLIWVNFIGGLFRGLGMAIGFTILGAVLLYFLKALVQWNLPVIGEHLADLVKIVQESLNK